MAEGKPEFIGFEQMKFVNHMQISLTVDGLILTFQCVEAAEELAGRKTKPVPMHFLLTPKEALAVGNELTKRATSLIQATKQ